MTLDKTPAIAFVKILENPAIASLIAA